VADPGGCAPRLVFGGYVQARLAEVEAAYPGQIHRLTGEVASVETDGLTLSDGRRIASDAVVLTTGNPAPKTASGASARVLSDPWAPGALEAIGADDDILIVGTGLTMVDILHALEGQGWRSGAQALSRRGPPPRARARRPRQPHTPTPAAPASSTSAAFPAWIPPTPTTGSAVSHGMKASPTATRRRARSKANPCRTRNSRNCCGTSRP